MKTLANLTHILDSILSASQRDFTNLELKVDGELPAALFGRVFVVALMGTVEPDGADHKAAVLLRRSRWKMLFSMLL